METTHPPLDGSVVIFITSKSVIIQIPDLVARPCQTLLCKPILTNLLSVPYEARAIFLAFLFPLVPVSVYYLLLHRPDCKPNVIQLVSTAPLLASAPLLAVPVLKIGARLTSRAARGARP